MAGYTELREDFRIVERTSNTDGVRSFIEETGGADTLPSLGDPFSVSFPAVLCNEISSKFYHVEGTTNKKKIVCNFTTRQSAEQPEGDDVAETDSDQRFFSAGVEAISIGGGDKNITKWFWNKGGLANGTMTPVGAPDQTPATNVRFSKFLPRGSFSRYVVVAQASKNSYLQSRVFPNLGKINDATFEGFAHGNVLFSSITGNLKLQNDGVKVWVFQLIFDWKIIYDPAGAPKQWSWNYKWNKNAEAADKDWQAPVNKLAPGVTNLLYEKTTMTGIYPLGS